MEFWDQDKEVLSRYGYGQYELDTCIAMMPCMKKIKNQLSASHRYDLLGIQGLPDIMKEQDRANIIITPISSQNQTNSSPHSMSPLWVYQNFSSHDSRRIKEVEWQDKSRK